MSLLAMVGVMLSSPIGTVTLVWAVGAGILALSASRI